MDEQFDKNLKAMEQAFETGLKMLVASTSGRSSLRKSLDHINAKIQEYRKYYMEDNVAADEQTGKIFRLTPEKPVDIVAAAFSSLYLVAMLLFLSWLLFEICVGRGILIDWLGLKDIANDNIFRLVACTVLGGGLGGVINGIRSLIVWHSEQKAFGWRFLWKYITRPLLGVVLAAMVYAIVRGGIAAFAGELASSKDVTTQALAAFALGALSGYGSHKVFIWFDSHVNRLFKVGQVQVVQVPNIVGKSRDDAEKTLKEAKLNPGTVHEQPADNADDVDKVIYQDPAAGSQVPEGTKVTVTIGAKKTKT